MANLLIDAGEWLQPTIGCRQLLQHMFDLLCDTTPPAGLFRMRLFTNDIVPACNTEAADLVEATFGGYAEMVIPGTPGLCSGEVQAPGVTPGGQHFLPLDQVTFEATSSVTPESVFGAYIIDDNVLDELIWVRRFVNGPASMFANGDKIKLLSQLILNCSTPAP